MGSVEVSFFLYARSVRHVCSVAMFSDPNPRRLEDDDFRRGADPSVGSDGLFLTFDLGLIGGLVARLSVDSLRDGVSSTMVLLPGLVGSGAVGVLTLAARLNREVRR